MLQGLQMLHLPPCALLLLLLPSLCLTTLQPAEHSYSRAGHIMPAPPFPGPHAACALLPGHGHGLVLVWHDASRAQQAALLCKLGTARAAWAACLHWYHLRAHHLLVRVPCCPLVSGHQATHHSTGQSLQHCAAAASTCAAAAAAVTAAMTAGPP